MISSVITDADIYLSKLHELIRQFGIIIEPNELYSLVEVKMTRNQKIVGWEIKDKEIKFASGEFLDCDEFGEIDRERWKITGFSFHFQPVQNQELLSYRVDLDKLNGLHLNPVPLDESKHLKPDELELDISDFNCILATRLAIEYLNHKIYPADTGSGIYNKVLNGVRRQLKL